jgi:hypothetical protein
MNSKASPQATIGRRYAATMIRPPKSNLSAKINPASIPLVGRPEHNSGRTAGGAKFSKIGWNFRPAYASNGLAQPTECFDMRTTAAARKKILEGREWRAEGREKKNSRAERTGQMEREAGSRKKILRAEGRRHGPIQEKKIWMGPRTWRRAKKKNSRAASRQNLVKSCQIRTRPVPTTAASLQKPVNPVKAS